MYIVMKDGLYLMGVQDMGVREFDGDGNYVEVLTGIYGDKKRDAMLVKDIGLAVRLGGKAIKVSKGECA